MTSVKSQHWHNVCVGLNKDGILLTLENYSCTCAANLEILSLQITKKYNPHAMDSGCIDFFLFG